MRGSAHLAWAVRIVETHKYPIQLGGFIPLNQEHAIEFTGGAVGMHFVDERGPTGSKSDMHNSMTRASPWKEFAALHRFAGVPVPCERLRELVHFGALDDFDA